jgi:hypothetical protein
MRRFDLYGFLGKDIDAAASAVEDALGITLVRRDSSYRGIYYGGGKRDNDYLLQSNDDESRWKSRFPAYTATLMVNNLEGMDAIKGKLAAGVDGVEFLQSILQSDEPSQQEEPAEEEPS